MTDIPADVMEAAFELSETVIEQCEGCGCDECHDSVEIRIAEALQDAEKRGEQRERERCLEITKGFPGLAYAIRNGDPR